MADTPIDQQPIPRHFLDKKTVWNDNKGRTLICFEIWENANRYEIEFLLLNGKKPLEFVRIPWLDVHRAITSKTMQQAFI